MKTKGRLLMGGVFGLMLGFLILTLALLGQDPVWHAENRDAAVSLIDREEFPAAARAEASDCDCLIVTDHGKNSEALLETMTDTLEQLRVGTVTADPSDIANTDLGGYKKLILCADDLSLLGDGAAGIIDWTEDGGQLMLLGLHDGDEGFDYIAEYAGINGKNAAEEFYALSFREDFMLGSEMIEGVPFDRKATAFPVLLEPDCRIYLESDGGKIPLIWKRSLGKGSVAAVNMSLSGKETRGLYASAYSLLGEYFAWSVINGSAFYIDSFPAPTPGGEAERIYESYGIGTGDFIDKVFWRDMKALAEEYGLRYTGGLIETNWSLTDGPFSEELDSRHHHTQARELCGSGGELALGGYNRMSLVLEGETSAFYPWRSAEDISAALTELHRFTDSEFSGESFSVYIPASNVLSESARRLIGEDFKSIRAITGVYIGSDVEYTQEFCVADDGIIETPRITHGYSMDFGELMAAVSELNLHYVSSHYISPEDTLDGKEESQLGWSEMYRLLREYTGSLNSAAPGIRKLTGSELAAAVQRYDMLSVGQEISSGELKIKLGGFVDEAWLMVRLSSEPEKIEGGSIESLGCGIYLVGAEEPDIKITLK